MKRDKEIEKLFIEITETEAPSYENITDRLNHIIELAGSYGHAIINQLTIIIGKSELALQNAEADLALQGQLNDIQSSASCAAAVAHKLMALRHRGKGC